MAKKFPLPAVFVLLFFVSFFLPDLVLYPGRAAAGGEESSAGQAEGTLSRPYRIVWTLPGAGKPAAPMRFGPNGRLFLATGNGLAAVDENGKKTLEVSASAGGGAGGPVFAGRGSIYLPGGGAVREVKLNGAAGWGFAVYTGSGGGSTPAALAAGPGGALYLPLPSGLFALEQDGRCRWSLLQWDSGGNPSAKPAKDTEIIACAGTSEALFVVSGKKGKGYTLAALDGEGNFLSRFWLGDLKSCRLAAAAGPGGKETLFVVANPAKVDRMNKGTIYAFAGGGRSGEPRWAFRLPKDDLSAPAIAKDGTLYFVSGGRLYALDAENGRLKWELPLLNLSSPPAVDEARGLVFALGSDGRLFAVSREGRMAWETMLDGGASQPPLAGPDALYVLTDKGTLYRLAAGP